MRCVRCAKRSKGEPESFSLRCPSCGHRVAATRKRDGCTDRAVKAAIETLASNGLRFLPEHVGYELLRRGQLKAKRLNKSGLFGLVLLPVAVLLGGLPGFSIGVIAIAFVLRWLLRKRKVPRGAFRAARKYLEINPSVQMVEEGKILTPGEAETELAVSARRVLICQHERYADYLLANQFHLEHACPVVGPDVKHSALFPGIAERVQKLPDATVFLLHDMTKSGMDFVAGFRDQSFAANDQATIVDLGLSPGQEKFCPDIARPLKEIRGAGGAATGSTLDKKQGLELTALRPQRLLVGLAQALPLAVPLAVTADAAAASRGDSGG